MNEIKPCAYGAERCVLLGGTGRISVRPGSSDESMLRHAAPRGTDKRCFTLSVHSTSPSFATLPALLRPSSSTRGWAMLALARFA